MELGLLHEASPFNQLQTSNTVSTQPAKNNSVRASLSFQPENVIDTIDVDELCAAR